MSDRDLIAKGRRAAAAGENAFVSAEYLMAVLDELEQARALIAESERELKRAGIPTPPERAIEADRLDDEDLESLFEFLEAGESPVDPLIGGALLELLQMRRLVRGYLSLAPAGRCPCEEVKRLIAHWDAERVIDSYPELLQLPHGALVKNARERVFQHEGNAGTDQWFAIGRKGIFRADPAIKLPATVIRQWRAAPSVAAPPDVSGR